MQVAEQKVVTIEYTLRESGGEVIDQSPDEGFAYLHGAQNIIPGLEAELAGKQAGDEVSVTLDPSDAYGERQDVAVEKVPKHMFPEDAEVAAGNRFNAQLPNGQPILLTVREAGDEEVEVEVDPNHPLAGMTLEFDVKVVDVREASEEEVEHGHAHGAAGQQH